MANVDLPCASPSSRPQEWAVRLLVRQQLLRRRYLERHAGGTGSATVATAEKTARTGTSLSGLAAAVERAFLEGA